MLNFEELSLLAIFLAAVAKFFVGGLWFSKALFGGLWFDETGRNPDNLGDPKSALIIAFAICLLFSFSFAVVLQMMALDLRSVMAVAIIMALGLTAAQNGISFAFEGRSLKLFLIYATQTVVEFVTVALILTLM